MALGDARYIDAARNAATFVRSKMYDQNRLLRSYREGPGPAGLADDYASITGAALDLYEATGDIAWLQWASELQATLDELFLDREHGGYFSATAADPSILIRIKEDHDGAEPAPGSLAARNCLRLARMLDDPALEARAIETIRAFGEKLRSMPSSMPAMLTALLLSQTPPRQIIIAGPLEDAATQALAHAARALSTPESVLLYADTGPGQQWLGRRLQAIRTAAQVDGKPAAYVCENFTCRLPITNPADLRHALG
jgi:uncharacterized protein YyaL (SSP411 family)